MELTNGIHCYSVILLGSAVLILGFICKGEIGSGEIGSQINVTSVSRVGSVMVLLRALRP